jgi:hypothetical protein
MPENTNFRFINSYSSNGIKQNKDTRRDVRSYVARVSHTSAGAKGSTTRLKGDKHRSTVVCKYNCSRADGTENSQSTSRSPPSKTKKMIRHRRQRRRSPHRNSRHHPPTRTSIRPCLLQTNEHIRRQHHRRIPVDASHPCTSSRHIPLRLSPASLSTTNHSCRPSCTTT